MANPSSPDNPSIGERRLAAIMFTDVVSFSARVQESEGLTLRLVQRDFKAITNSCKACGGQVLKTTGDGLLMAFPTAGAAVDCALKVQAMIAHASKTLPPEQVLEHRIGIHLGDVFVAEHDVMGNDVNIAARVLSEAGGGEICVSQTVYDVVKHRLTVKGIYLGQRELKNIKEPVSIFRLPTAAGKGGSSARPAGRSRRRALLTVLVLVIIGGTAFAVWKFTLYSKPPSSPVAMPATTRSAPTGTAKFIERGPRGVGDLRIRFGRLGGMTVSEETDFMPERPYIVPLTDNPTGAELTLLEGEVFRGRGRAGRNAGAIASSGSIKMRVRLPDSVPRRLSLGFGDVTRDPTQEQRTQSIWIRDAGTGELLVQSAIANFRDGAIVAFDITGVVDVIIKSERGPGAVLQAVYFNPVQ